MKNKEKEWKKKMSELLKEGHHLGILKKTDEFRKAMSELRKYEYRLGIAKCGFKKGNQYAKGIEHTDEWRKNMSKKMSGKNNPMYGTISPMRGKKHTTEQNAKLSKRIKKLWEEGKYNHLSEKMKGIHPSPATEFKKGHPQYNTGRTHMKKNWFNFNNIQQDINERQRIRLESKERYKAKKCWLCEIDKNLILHHYTEPYEIDKVIPLCRNHHGKVNQEILAFVEKDTTMASEQGYLERRQIW